MKKIFSRVAHVFKHDAGDEQQDPSDTSPPSPAVGDPGEHASLTSVDSGVLVDVSEPERSPTGAGAGAGAEAEAVVPVTDRARECAKPAAGNDADRATCSEAEVAEADRTTQTAAGQLTAGEEQQPEMVEAAGDSEREQETPTYSVNEEEFLYEAVPKQGSTAGIVNVQQESVAATEAVTVVTVPERPSEVQRAGPGIVQKQATPTQVQDPVTGVKQEPQEPVLFSQQQDPVSESVEEEQGQELVEELAEDPAAVERPATEPSGDLQSGTGAAAAVGAADSAGPGHPIPGLPGTAAAELTLSSRQELPVEADSVNGGQDQSDSCVETNRSVTVVGMPLETVEGAPVSPADEVELSVTADGSDNVTVPEEPSAMDTEAVGRAAEEPAATGDLPVTDSDGVLLETGTEDTADDLDGKPKEKKKKRKKKRKNKSEQSIPVSLVAETLAKDAGEDRAKSALSEEISEKPTDSVKKAVAEPSDQTVGSDSADFKTNKTKAKVSSSLTAGTRASTAKAKKSTASQAANKPVDSAAQRDGPAKSALAKQSTTEASGNRSVTPTRPLQNPAKSRLKTQLRKETSVESNASTSSRGSSGARSARSGKRSSATGTKPADQTGARANSAARRDSLPLSVSSGSTTVSTRGEHASSRRARAKGAKQQVDKSTPTARSSTPTAKNKSDAVCAAKSPPERKTAVSQAGNVKKEKKTKAPMLKDKKVSGAKKTVAVTKVSDAKSASPARVPGAAGTKTKVLDVTGTNNAGEGRESADMTAQPAGGHSLPSHQTVTVSSAQGSPERPPLLEQDTIEDTSVLRPPLTQYDTVQDSTERPPLSEQEAVEASRPPLTHNDTIDGPADRPMLAEQDTLEDTSVLRPPTVQHDTAHGTSPDRPPLVQQETIDLSVTGVASLSSEQPTASCHSSVGQPSVATQSTTVVAEAAVPQVTLSPSSAAAPTSSSTSAVPTLPSAPSAAASDGSSRRSSMDVLDGPPRLRRSISGHGEQPGAPRPDAVLEAMSQVHADSEARLAARRQARAEAREIRMRELERQQREAEQNGEKLDDFSDVSPRPAPSAVSSRASRGPSAASTGRRGSEDSAEDGASTSSGGFHLRDVRHELRELEEKLRKTMVTSAQLDNDKSTLSYQVELLKDKLEEMQEAHTQLQREHRTRCSEHEQLKRVSNRLREDYECCKTLLEERDKLIAENGLVLVGDEEDSEPESATGAQRPQKALVSQNAAQLLDKAGGGTLDSRLRRLGEEKNELEDQLRRLKLELEEERHMSARARITGSGAGAEPDQVQREVARQVGEYRFKLQKADQDITNLQTAVQRLENQVARYKAAAETAEKSEEELKGEKRKLQRELRESLTRVDELETTNSHLQKRLDKLKNARSALLKDLSTE